ncbi:insecticyanin-A-like [Aricia agestis]|uniref:insecticyanin-A-like n=1 Tax=Aricia agestis TaxID=91739 RepID=UPI001C20BE4E|nr:insecticyanin-A-like [Aricia agestis]
MLEIVVILFLLEYQVEGVVQNASCPEIAPMEIDLKELDGKWYLAAVASDMNIDGDCAMIMFSHKTNNTTDISIHWIANNTSSFYNGSVSLAVDAKSNNDVLLVTYTDQKTETYSILGINYEHYAVIFACYDDPVGNSSTYELWKLTRSPHLKKSDAVKLDQALITYNLQNTSFMFFNNTEDSCVISKAYSPNSASLLISSAAAMALFRRLY